MNDEGGHFAVRPSRRGQWAAVGAGVAALAAAVACWMTDSAAGSGFFLLANVFVLGAVTLRMQEDPGAWRFPVGENARRVVLAVLTVGLAVLGLAAMFQIGSTLGS